MLNRRQFVWGAAGGTALLGSGGLASSLWRKPGHPFSLGRSETWANSICQLCPSGCGVTVRLANGSPVVVRGNPLHPVNRGGLCARGNALLQVYYDPDRFTGPLKRDGGVIGGQHPITWDAALKEIGDRLRAAAMGGHGRVALIHGEHGDIGTQLLSRLVRATGSGWSVQSDALGARLNRHVVRAMHGTSLRPVYNLARSDFAISFDSCMLDAGADVMNLHRGFADLRSAGGRFVHAGPRMGTTGAKADSWLPIMPATAGVLALGVAHIIIKEGLADEAFLGRWAARFDDWIDEDGVKTRGLRNWILREFSPQRVAEITGIGWDQIIRTARAFGSASRPLAIGPLGGLSGASEFDLAAVHALNAVVGAIDVPGGVLFARPLPVERVDLPGGRQDDPPEPSVEELADWIVSDRRPSIDVLLVHNADPMFASRAPALLRKALAKVPLVVCTSPMPTDTTACAHFVLPDLLWLEQPCDSLGVNGEGQPVFSGSPAAVRPRTDGRPVADLAMTLAKAAGDEVAARFPWAGAAALRRAHIAALFRSGSGDAFADLHHATWAQLLQRGGWRLPTYESEAELASAIDRKGGWWDPAYYHGEWRRVLPGPGGRLDLEPVRTMASPKRLQPPEKLAGDGLHLYLYGELSLDNQLGGSVPYLQDIGSPLSERGWNMIAEVHPETAEARGIAHGDRVRVVNGARSVEAIATLSQAVRPDVIALNVGSGRTHGGRYAAGIGANPYRVLDAPSAIIDRSLPPVSPTVVHLHKA